MILATRASGVQFHISSIIKGAPQSLNLVYGGKTDKPLILYGGRSRQFIKGPALSAGVQVEAMTRTSIV